MFVNVDVERLVNARKKSGLTRCKLSLLAGLPSNALSRIEAKKGLCRTSDLRLNAIANVLKVDVSNLIAKEI